MRHLLTPDLQGKLRDALKQDRWNEPIPKISIANTTRLILAYEVESP